MDVIRTPHHRQHRAVGIHADQRALGPLGGIGLDRGGGGGLHLGVQRRPYLDRFVVIGQQQIQLRQRPIGEITYRILLHLTRQIHRIEVGVIGLIRRNRARIPHRAQHGFGALDCGLGVGGGGIMRGRLDQPRDNRRLGQAHLRGAMVEEFARRGINAIGAAAEIDLVQIEFEDLILGKPPFQRHGDDRLTRLAGKSAIVVQEHRARQLLGDGRGTLPAMAAARVHHDRTRDANRVDAYVRAKPAILCGDDRRLHHMRDLGVAQPMAIAGSEGHQLAAITRAHHDGLADLAGFQLGKAGQRLRLHPHHDGHQNSGKQRRNTQPQRGAFKQPFQEPGFRACAACHICLVTPICTPLGGHIHALARPPWGTLPAIADRRRLVNQRLHRPSYGLGTKSRLALLMQ